MNYARTCEDWLKLQLKHEKRVKEDLKATYGDQAGVWFNRWIVFYLVHLQISELTNRVARNCLLIMMEMNGLWLITCFRRDRKFI